MHYAHLGGRTRGATAAFRHPSDSRAIEPSMRSRQREPTWLLLNANWHYRAVAGGVLVGHWS
jgi:hypothetical protein